MLSVWNLEGERTGRRDDVYRVIEMMAFILSDCNRTEGIKDMMADKVLPIPTGAGAAEAEAAADERIKIRYELIRQYKKDYPLFQPSPILGSGGSCDGIGLGDKMRTTLQNVLEQVANSVRELSHPDMAPNYESIILKLRKLERAVERSIVRAGSSAAL